MPDKSETNESEAQLKSLIDERITLEEGLKNQKGDPSEKELAEFDRAYGKLQRGIARLFAVARSEKERLALVHELLHIMENRIVYLHNFVMEPTADTRTLASLVGRFLSDTDAGAAGLTPLELTYYRGIVALYGGDKAGARSEFLAACESEESDEANDIKYKSYVILGNILHEEEDYAGAKNLHDRSLQYSANGNVKAQALAFKALNSYALRDYDEALGLFEEALALFDPGEPFFNSYFYRNSLLFAGTIYVSRKDYERAESAYRKVLEHVEPASYDYFDALAQLGKICYSGGRFPEAADLLNQAIDRHKFTENEHLVDTYFWLGRTYLRMNDSVSARRLLEKVAQSEVNYERKPQAAELLSRV